MGHRVAQWYLAEGVNNLVGASYTGSTLAWGQNQNLQSILFFKIGCLGGGGVYR